MRIKLTTLMSGPAGTFQPGTELDVDDKKGRELVDGNYALELKRPVVETAAVKAPEKAVTAAEQQAAVALSKIAASQGGNKGGKSRTVKTVAVSGAAAPAAGQAAGDVAQATPESGESSGQLAGDAPAAGAEPAGQAGE